MGTLRVTETPPIKGLELRYEVTAIDDSWQSYEGTDLHQAVESLLDNPASKLWVQLWVDGPFNGQPRYIGSAEFGDATRDFLMKYGDLK